jgi:Fe2+ transport system protein FeoA
MILTQLKPGEIAKILDLDGGRHHRQKLCLRGISEGSILRVISNIGPVTVEVGRNTVSIGRRMANRIRVMRL